MAGINLSQSIQEKQAIARGNFFDKGFFINFAIFVVVAGAYGGSYWYLGTLEAEVATLQGDLSQKTANLKGVDANRAADLRVRLDAIGTNLKSDPDPKDVFQQLEEYTVPSIRLTDYTQKMDDSATIVRGLTTNLKYLAQQMLSYKKMAGVSSVHVEDVEYNDVGQIEFDLRLLMAPNSEKSASSL